MMSLLGFDGDSVVQLFVRHAGVCISLHSLVGIVRPFHAAIGILTTRMLLNLSKAVMSDKNRSDQSTPLETLAFQGAGSPVRKLLSVIYFLAS